MLAMILADPVFEGCEIRLLIPHEKLPKDRSNQPKVRTSRITRGQRTSSPFSQLTSRNEYGAIQVWVKKGSWRWLMIDLDAVSDISSG
jgi:hypothetical protein